MPRVAAWWLVAAMSLYACATSDAVGAARRGDAAALQKAIEPGLRSGKLGEAEAASIARALAEHEIESAKSEDGAEHVRELRACASELSSALAERAETHDAPGAEAAMALLESDGMSTGDARKYASDADDGWRAVGARGLVRKQDAEARRKALVDPSARVRRAAMRACAEAKDPDDVPALFEAARVDPDMLARSSAVRAIATIDPPATDAAERLRDLWSGGDEALREDVALAHTSPHIAASGGSAALRVLLAAGHGAGAVSAAGLVLRRAPRPGETAAFDAETQRSAVAVLLHAIEDEPRRERMLALATSPLSEPALLEAVKTASRSDGDLALKEAALSRLLDVPSERDAAQKALIPFANPDSPEQLARAARLALAAAGVRSVQAWIEADLRAPSASTKLLAANALASLGRAARATPLLADPDAHVRLGAACTLIRSRGR